MEMDTLPAWLLPQTGKLGYRSTDEVVMDRAERPEQGSSSWQRSFIPRGSDCPHTVPDPKALPSLLTSRFSISQHHELYAWKHLMSSGCIRHLSIPALRLSFIPSTILPSLPRAAVPGGLFPPFSRNRGAGNAGAAPCPRQSLHTPLFPQHSPCKAAPGKNRALEFGNISQFSAGY